MLLTFLNAYANIRGMKTLNSAPNPQKTRRLIAGVTLAGVAAAAGGYELAQNSDSSKPAATHEAAPKTDTEVLASFNGKSVPNVTTSFGKDVAVYSSTDMASRVRVKPPSVTGFDVQVGLPLTVEDSQHNQHQLLGFNDGTGEVWIDETQTPAEGQTVAPNNGPQTITLRVENGQVHAANSHTPINTWTAEAL